MPNSCFLRAFKITVEKQKFEINNKTPQSYILYVSGDIQTLIWFIWDFIEMRVLCIVKTLSIHSMAHHFQSQQKENLPTL